MLARVKAVVFKTSQLKATQAFFSEVLKLQIKESSARHFVIYSKNIRLVFVESTSGFEVEMYLSNVAGAHSQEINALPPAPGIKSSKDPNGIAIIITS
jgi:catechol-2,3-dioxygenase